MKKTSTPSKSAKKPELKHEEFFVYLKNPLEFRRQLLESSKKSLVSMQHYHRISVLREKKVQEIHKLQQSFKEIQYLIMELNAKLPKYDHSVLGPIKQQKVSVPVAKPEAKAKKPVHEKTDLEKLEDSLADIERKLHGLQ